MRSSKKGHNAMPPYSPWCLLRSSRVGGGGWGEEGLVKEKKKKQDAGLRQLRCIGRNDFNNLRFLHLPICRRVLHSFNLVSGFPYLTIIDVQSAPPLCCKLEYSLTLSSASSEKSLGAI